MTFGLVLGAAIVVALGVFTDVFGSDEKTGESRQARESRVLVSDRERSRFADESPESTFLEFWANLQFGDFQSAATTYDPRLVDFIDARRLDDSLKEQRTLYLKSKPKIIRVRERGDRATVRYTVLGADDKLTPSTVTFVKRDGEWKILYDTLLDGILRLYAQTKAQNRIDPTPEGGPAASAIEAGESAERLQRRFLEQLEEGGGEQGGNDQNQQDEQQQGADGTGAEGTGTDATEQQQGVTPAQ